ncbi:MAG: hypothetical protein WA866_07450, partial [Pseudolabrys sp.]
LIGFSVGEKFVSTAHENSLSFAVCEDFILDGECPLWVKSRHLQRTKACPLYPQQRHRLRISACPLWANSGHSARFIYWSHRADQLHMRERIMKLS